MTIAEKVRFARLMPWLLFILIAQPCLAQSIKIQVTNANDGAPLQDQDILATFLYGRGPDLNQTVKLRTTAAGEAKLGLPERVPNHLWVIVHLKSPYWHCACQQLIATQDVIQKGITVPDDGRVSAADRSATAIPGEIRFYARPLSFFERLLYPFLKW